MASTLYFYLKQPLKITEEIVASFQDEFDKLLEDSFTDEELEFFEGKIDQIAAVYAQPLFSELSFDDFYAKDSEETAQRAFFNSCKSSISFENLPYLESNPFQVTYLQELLNRFEEVLIDQGGVNELCFKTDFLKKLQGHKTIDGYMGIRPVKEKPKHTMIPVDPIDFLVLDVYREVERLKDKTVNLGDLPQGLKKVFFLMQKESLDPATLYMRSGLNAKDFDDGLERLKFFLRKL